MAGHWDDSTTVRIAHEELGVDLTTNVAPSAPHRYFSPRGIDAFYRELRDHQSHAFRKKVEELKRLGHGDKSRVDEMVNYYIHSTYRDCEVHARESQAIQSRQAVDAHDRQGSCLVCSSGSPPSTSPASQPSLS
jgi:hypothetical protein